MSGATQVYDFSAVYAEHAALIKRVLRRRGVQPADVEDVMQEAFVTIHRLLPEFEGRARIETWLHAVAWRVAANYHKRAQTRTRREIAARTPEAALAPVVMESSAAAELRATLESVHPDDRDVFVLHDVGGMSIAEIAELVSASRARVRLRLEHARVAVQQRLASEEGVAPAAGHGHCLAEDFASHPRGEHDYDCAEYAFSSLGDTVITLWRGRSAVEGLEILAEILVDAVAKWGHLRYFAVIEPTSTPPNRKGRQIHTWGAERVGKQVRAAAFALESPGLVRLVPPIVNSFFLLSGNPMNVRFFPGLAPATTWLAQYTEKSDAEALHAHVELLRARIDRHCAAEGDVISR
jgi:RNA polymerase sigma-70 factor (ECF subfamily)